MLMSSIWLPFFVIYDKKDFEIASQLPEHLFELDKQRRAQ